MSFRRGGAKKRRDALEPDLLAALHAAGVQTWQLHGTGLPDLLCFFRGRFTPLEVKSSASSPLTPYQRDMPWPVVRSIDDAFAALGITVRPSNRVA
jgi:hypothetical protein